MEEVTINPITELPELTQDWEIDSWRAQQNLFTRTQEKGTVTPQETDPDLPGSVQESPTEAWVSGGLLQGQGHLGQQCHDLHCLHHSLASGQTQPHPSTDNWIKDFLSMAPPIRTRLSFPLSQSPPSGSFHKPLILLHQRADRPKTTITKN